MQRSAYCIPTLWAPHGLFVLVRNPCDSGMRMIRNVGCMHRKASHRRKGGGASSPTCSQLHALSLFFPSSLPLLALLPLLSCFAFSHWHALPLLCPRSASAHGQLHPAYDALQQCLALPTSSVAYTWGVVPCCVCAVPAHAQQHLVGDALQQRPALPTSSVAYTWGVVPCCVCAVPRPPHFLSGLHLGRGALLCLCSTCTCAAASGG